MKIDDVITLDNDAKYLLLEKVNYKDKDYFFAVGVFDNQDIDYTDYLFFEFGTDEEGEYVEKVTDDKLYKELLIIMSTDAVVENNEDLRTYLVNELETIEENLG